ncbi:unnamed protein product [Coccothraustes coccothraustes]
MLPRSSSTGEARRELFRGAQQLPKPAGTLLSRRGTARRRTAGASGPGAAGTCEQQRSSTSNAYRDISAVRYIKYMDNVQGQMVVSSYVRGLLLLLAIRIH